MIAAHADWSVAPGKRWMAIARRGAGGWRLAAPRPVGDPPAFAAALLAEDLPAALGLDLPLGVPRAYAAQRPEAGFLDFLRARAGDARFFRVNETLETISLDAPFYPQRGVKGMTRASHAAALGLPDAEALHRWCDRATASRPAGAPPFWTLGANQSGKAAITAWRDWLAPALAAGAPLCLWPFEGALQGLLRPGRLALAEVYPAEALRQLGLSLPGSKRDQAARRALAEPLRAVLDRLGIAPSAEALTMIRDGFGADAAGEDRLDCTLGLAALVAVLDGRREDVVPADDMVRRWEGWVLGQGEGPKGLAPFSR
ncbi:hypothetical protein KTR66_12330 [Roseococcus sp. SDR]|uniref:hypothetical protein n=1 Tax=Roseococcus sp. SDR TaxID=2835532 RepID=UPI001BCEC37C|nr:hypothetical protein [Roseococcus sp. SDR]MBS7790789.1 hypothetical protein [Roseococcus sp. SDR]MBV1846103.1 hypothetical protein [Roseococcus sp. SDR]